MRKALCVGIDSYENENIIERNQEKCLKSISSSPRMAPP